MVFNDGRIEIDVAPAEVAVVHGDGPPRLVPREELEPLIDDQVCDTVDATRRWQPRL